MLDPRRCARPVVSIDSPRCAKTRAHESGQLGEPQVADAPLDIAHRPSDYASLCTLSGLLSRGASMRAEAYERHTHPPLVETVEIAIGALFVLLAWAGWYLATERYHLTNREVIEIGAYMAIGLTAVSASILLL